MITALNPLPDPRTVESFTPILDSIFDTVQVIQSFDDDDEPVDDDAVSDDDDPVDDDDIDIDDDDDFPPTQPG